jgi:hypothetical protein
MNQKKKQGAGVGTSLVVIALAILYFNGNLDNRLVKVGLNHGTCITNAFGATYCDAAATTYCNSLNNAGLDLDGTGCGQLLQSEDTATTGNASTVISVSAPPTSTPTVSTAPASATTGSGGSGSGRPKPNPFKAPGTSWSNLPLTQQQHLASKWLAAPSTLGPGSNSDQWPGDVTTAQLAAGMDVYMAHPNTYGQYCSTGAAASGPTDTLNDIFIYVADTITVNETQHCL